MKLRLIIAVLLISLFLVPFCNSTDLVETPNLETIYLGNGMYQAIICAEDDPIYNSTSYDGDVFDYDTAYNTVWSDANGKLVNAIGALSNLGQRYSSTKFYIYRLFLFFDTTSIPVGSVIASASINLRGSFDFSATDFNITVQKGSGTYPSNYPDPDNDGLSVSDYDQSKYSGGGGYFDTSGWSIVGYNAITLNSTGIGYIQIEGMTKLVLRSSGDIDSIPPSGNEYVSFYTSEQGVGYIPYLSVTYSAPMTVTTQAGTGQWGTGFIANGNIASAGVNATTRGFCYCAGTTGDPTIANSTKSETGSFGVGTYWLGITGLTQGTSYRVRAYAMTGSTPIYGDTVTVTTLGWLGTWAYRVQITIDHTKVTSDLTNFPVLLYLSASSGVGHTDISTIFDLLGADANYNKVAVTKSDGSTQLYAENELYSTSNRKAYYWTCANVSSTSDTVLYFYFDSAQSANTGYIGVVGSTPGEAVWDSYFQGVYHLSDSSGTIKDSTSNGYDLSISGSPTYSQTGEVYNAISLDGVDDYLAKLGTPIVIPPTATFEAWVKYGTVNAGAIVTASHSSGKGFGLLSGAGGNNGNATAWILETTDKYAYSTSALGTNTWGYYSAVFTSSTSRDAYLNGTNKGSNSDSAVPGTLQNTNVGCINNGASSFFNGTVDEIRLSNTSRSSAWISASYYTESDNIGTWLSGLAVTTQACDSSTSSSFMAHGTINMIGNSPTIRGFCYYVGTTGDPTLANSTVSESGTFSTGTYSLGVTGLTQGTSYRVRAFAIDGTTSYGTTVTVSTLGWLGTWAYRAQITIDHTKFASSLTNFPVMVYVSASSGTSLTDLSDVFTKLSADGNRTKIAITTSDGVTQQYVEIESYSTSNKKAWLWTSTNVSSTTDTVLYLYYDPGQAANTGYVGDVASTPGKAVWDANFKAVWHMGEAASPALDSTGNSNSAAQSGGVTFGSTGKIGTCTAYDGSDDYLSPAFISGLGNTTYTMEAWFKTTSVSTAGDMFAQEYDGNHEVRFELIGASAKLYLQTYESGYGSVAGTTTVSDGVWRYGAVKKSSTTGYVRLNAAQENSGTVKNVLSMDRNYIGVLKWNAGATYYFNGTIDELRISNTARSDDWLASTYYIETDAVISWSLAPSAPTGVTASDGTNSTSVILNWTKPSGATGYYVFRNSTYRETVGDVASYTDTNATAPFISGISVSATTSQNTYVGISVSASAYNGTVFSYYIIAFNANGNSSASSSDTGFRGPIGSLGYQWYNSTDNSIFNLMSGVTSTSYNDTSAPAPSVTVGSFNVYDYATYITLEAYFILHIDGTTAYYKCLVSANNATSTNSSSTSGYRVGGAWNTTLYRSAGASDASYSILAYPNITDTGWPTFINYATYDDTTTSAPSIAAGTTGATDGASSSSITVNLTGASASNGETRYYYYEIGTVGCANYTTAHSPGYRPVGTLTYQLQKSPDDITYANVGGSSTSYSPYVDSSVSVPSITGGSTVASDGTNTTSVELALLGSSFNNGDTTWYRWYLTSSGATANYSVQDTGYTGYTDSAYQWQVFNTTSGAYEDIIGANYTPYYDTAALAGIVSPGIATASDGCYNDKVNLSLLGSSVSNGTVKLYKCVLDAVGATENISSIDGGFRLVESPQYQWYSSADGLTYVVVSGANSTSFNDTLAPAPTITAGNISASDGASSAYVAVNLTGHSVSNGNTTYYLCEVVANGATDQNSTSDTGYRGTTSLTYQLLRSLADSDANYSPIIDGTYVPYYDLNGAVTPSGFYYLYTVSMTGTASENSTSDRGYVTVANVSATPPTVDALNSTSVFWWTAVLNGNITDIGTDNASIRGFQWGDSTGNYTGSWAEIGDFGVGNFSGGASGLSLNTIYFWRAFAANDGGASFSGELNFTTLAATLPGPPTNFVAVVLNTSDDGTGTIGLTWTMDANATEVLILYKMTGYPQNITDGNLAYNGTGTAVNLTGLAGDIASYYFSAWSINPFGYSVNHAQARTGGAGMHLLVFAILPLGFLGMFLWKRLSLLAYGSAATWGLFGFFAFQQSTSPDPAHIQDIYMGLFWLCIAFVIGMALLPLAMREKKEPEEIYVDELDSDLEKIHPKKELPKREKPSKFAQTGR